MKQITEDYVSFEVAKLLKEKGFDERCGTAYTTAEGYPIRVMGSTYSLVKNSDYDEFHYSMPSQSLALKWLREVHNWYIDIRFNRLYQYYIPIVYNMSGTLESIANLEERPKQYEQAVEAALLYVLENLI